jgi:natural product biosynthesis luciferase-like monooxygenase protein/amino acid adenylation domain-containing protein
MQENMFLQSQSSQDTGLAIEQLIGDLRERLDLSSFERAWQSVVARHAILRTSFHWENNEPEQRVHSFAVAGVESQDWRDIPANRREWEFERFLREDRKRTLDLAKAPLMRVTTLRFGEAHYRFVWTFHHLLLDASAFTIVLKELFAFYEAARAGYELELAPPHDYREYIRWIRSQDLVKAEVFWRETLRGFVAPTPLAVMSNIGKEAHDGIVAEETVELSNGVTDRLRALAKEHSISLNTILHGAWALLLSRYSGQDDIVFGTVRACRKSSVADAASMVGLMINTLPVRIRVDGSMTATNWLKEIRRQQLVARAYENTPLIKTLEWSGVADGRLFETIVNFQDPAWHDTLQAQKDGWSNRKFSIRNQPGYPLWVDSYAGNKLVLKIGFDASRFEQETIARMVSHLATLLESIATHPEKSVRDLAMLTRREEQQILLEWNQTEAEFPRDKRVHELFEEQAQRASAAVAVCDSALQLTYGELNAQASRLAHHLRRAGVQPETLVGVCMERSTNLVIAILAILKASGAYVPLDPAYPAERLAFMIEDSHMPVLLTEQKFVEKLPTTTIQTLCLDALDFVAHLDSESKTNPPPVGNSANLAYVIYTSGSTGQPKGVAIQHDSLMNLVAWHQGVYEVTSVDRATQVAGPAFDASVWELWPYLTAGASVHIPDEEIRLSPKRLLAWLKSENITLSFLPTPLAEAVMQEPWPQGMALRALLTGGEKLHRFPPPTLGCWLTNQYGPTENTVVTTALVAEPGDDTMAPPIGRPIANTRIYLLDANLRPVPIGVPGELCISGVGLARGYLNRPELTAEKFVANPFGSGDYARLYRTGDLARYLPDGNIEFLGRLDQQIKIRGQRVELGEIECVLSQHPSVREAVVTLDQNGEGQGRLIAYVTATPNHKPEAADLRQFLKQKLPEYMLPGNFAILDALPLTQNGKVDRRALPSPCEEGGRDTNFVPPRTATEEIVAGVWCEVLCRGEVGSQDNFFELGGHSLQATQVVSRLRNIFKVEVPLYFLFEAPTVAGLAAKIEAALRQGLPSDVAPLCPGARNGECPLSFAQERLWFLEQLAPGSPLHNVPVAFEIQGRLNVPALEQGLTELVRRHKTLRTVFSGKAPPVACEQTAERVAISTTDLASMPAAERDAEAQRLLVQEAQTPFDLSQSPLLRARLLRLAEDRQLLLLTLHHIASDGWSMGILYRELTQLYRMFCDGAVPSLPEPSIDYGDFAHWQRQWLGGDVMEKQLAYWKQQLAGELPLVNLPSDRPRPAVQTYRGAAKHFALPADLCRSLKSLSRREDVTLFMVLLGALQTLLHRYSGQEDILVGSPIAGRTRVETENVVGLFLNTLVLRGDLSGDPSFRELLKRIRQTALDAYAHQSIPFEKLVDAVQPERDLSRSPLFQVMFVLQNEPLPPLELAGLKTIPLAVHSGTAKFDLLISLEETADSLAGFVEYNTDLFEEHTIQRMVGHFETLLASIFANPQQRVSQLPMLPEGERSQLLVEWNDTRTEFEAEKCIHQLFEEQADRTPDAIAVSSDDEELTYAGLNQRADALAAELSALGIGPDARVAICVERSVGMMVGLLGILKAGGAYVPLDPTYPKERLTFMLEDSEALVLVTQKHLQAEFKFEIPNLKVLCLESSSAFQRSATPTHAPRSTLHDSQNLAYVIYTSGSTGKPKGVMVTHRNVVNFFAGMDRVLGTEPGVWLAVTSISFDISVLELFWTLTRGFKVIIHREQDLKHSTTRAVKAEPRQKKIDFSLFYFGSDAGERGEDKYRLLLEGAKFADENGFAAVWTPERHFNSIGGLYPNPSLTSTAIAMITRRIQIRAGSVVLPLHDPIRVAEEWAVVDNLSNGRAAVSFASGWHQNDFALAPENYSRRKEAMLEGIATLRRLWRGESVTRKSGSGQPIETGIFPRPVQSELPIWLTSSGNAETFQMAGERGLNVLTHLFGQSIADLTKKLEIYRAAWREAGHALEPCVGVMMHTFVWKDAAEAWEKVRGPLCDYLRTYRELSKSASPNQSTARQSGAETPEVLERLLQDAAQRYFESSGLFGTPETALQMVDKLRALGVDEIACLIDFGIDTDSVLASLRPLNQLRELSDRRSEPESADRPASIADQILRHNVTHMQCTPSLAGTLVLTDESARALQSLKMLLVGGEALPVSLAQKLTEMLPARVVNMYGPTETTIWSATHRLENESNTVPIGRPIANTDIYILDSNLQSQPVGVPGELFIGGEGVARGYLNRPELTAERFIRHPFSPDFTARLYRTGDVARYRADGVIEFLGRTDNQVKIRGHRIELGEIESKLARHPTVREAVVVAREIAADDKRLFAYLIASNGHIATATELRQFLTRDLPEHMVPSAFVELEKFPLTPNGKVDRKGLPNPETISGAREQAYAAPRSDSERTIAEIWQELLRVQQVGLHDNFFDLGGNSLLVVQAQVRLREVLGADLPVVRLFQYPTVSALAKFLSEQQQKNSLKKVHDRARRQRQAFAEQQQEMATV